MVESRFFVTGFSAHGIWKGPSIVCYCETKKRNDLKTDVEVEQRSTLTSDSESEPSRSER